MNIALHTLFNRPKPVKVMSPYALLSKRDVRLLEIFRSRQAELTIPEVASYAGVCEKTAGSWLCDLYRHGYIDKRFKSIKNKGHNNYKNVIVYTLIERK